MPLADRVLVRRLVPQAKTAGGVFLPDAKVEKVKEGEVLAVGPGRSPEGGGPLVPLTLRIGDKVHPIRPEVSLLICRPPLSFPIVLLACYERLITWTSTTIGPTARVRGTTY